MVIVVDRRHEHPHVCVCVCSLFLLPDLGSVHSYSGCRVVRGMEEEEQRGRPCVDGEESVFIPYDTILALPCTCFFGGMSSSWVWVGGI